MIAFSIESSMPFSPDQAHRYVVHTCVAIIDADGNSNKKLKRS